LGTPTVKLAGWFVVLNPIFVILGLASVKVVCAVNPEVSPVAVSVNVTPRSCGSTVKLLFVKLPSESATDESIRSS
jgi:hypothetical protein